MRAIGDIIVKNTGGNKRDVRLRLLVVDILSFGMFSVKRGEWFEVFQLPKLLKCLKSRGGVFCS